MRRVDAGAGGPAVVSSRGLLAYGSAAAEGSAACWTAWVWKDDAGRCYCRGAFVSLVRGQTGGSSDVLAVLQELGVPFISISAPSIVSGMSGESEKTLRETFEEAAVRDGLAVLRTAAHLLRTTQRLAPCILFIDEIDAITPKRETAQREMERRIVAQLLTCMDGACGPLPVIDTSLTAFRSQISLGTRLATSPL